MTGLNQHQRLYPAHSSQKARCYAEFAVSSPAVTETITRTHCSYP